jgi:hypothetical protein
MISRMGSTLGIPDGPTARQALQPELPPKWTAEMETAPRGRRFSLVSFWLSGAAEVGALAGVDADLFALVDEGGNLDDKAGFGLGRFCDAGCSSGF